MFLVKLAAGLALIIFGVRFLRKGLDRLLGGQLIVWLEKTTRSPIQSLCAGVVAGILAPSSTGVSLLTAQVLGNGKASAERMLAVLLGANIGITVLANIAALQLGDYAGLLLLLGVIGFQFTTLERLRGIGQCVLSLGFIFLAMNFLSEGAADFGRSHDVGLIFGVLDRHPYILCLAAAGLAVLLQSSTATVGLGIGLAAGGVLPNALFTIWIAGINVGLGITSLFISRANVEGRRLGLANLLVKLFVAILVIVLVPGTLFANLSPALPVSQQLALMHTAFNILVALVALPVLGWLLTMIKETMVPDSLQNNEAPRTFLNPKALETPPVALANATRETLRMTDAVKAMLQNLWLAHTQKSLYHIKDIRAQDDAVDEINQELMLYLSQLGEMNNFDRKWHFTLLSYANELEAIGDIIEKNLSATVAKQIEERLSLCPDDETALSEIYWRTALQFDLAIGFITTREGTTAQKMINARDEINAWCLTQRKSHYERLKLRGKEGLADSLCFLDMLEGLRRISNHLSTVAYGFKPSGLRFRKNKAAEKPLVANEKAPELPLPEPTQTTSAEGDM